MKEIMAQYRSEWKYVCSDGQLDLIRSRLEAVLRPDPHAGTNGVYRVRSLYFDDRTDSSAAGNDSGDGIRYKYRIRCYGEGESGLHLEKKQKRYGMGLKTSCPLSPNEYKALLDGDPGPVFWNSEQKLLREFCTLMMTRHFMPKAIIDYERTAFVEPVTHIRITLDRNVCAGYDFQSFLQGNYQLFPIQPPHQHILEVKFDAILPGWLRRVIAVGGLQQTTFSKYYLGRKLLEGIIR